MRPLEPLEPHEAREDGPQPRRVGPRQGPTCWGPTGQRWRQSAGSPTMGTVHITVTVTAKFEADTGEQGSPVAEQTFYRVEINPAQWSQVVGDLGEAALNDVTRMVAAAVAADPRSTIRDQPPLLG